MVGELILSPILERLEIDPLNPGACGRDWITTHLGAEHLVRNPANSEVVGSVKLAGVKEYETVVSQASDVFRRWRMLPAPKRGQIVREIADALRAHKEDLAALVTLEVGKV